MILFLYGTSEVKDSNLYNILNKFKSEGKKIGIIIDAPNSIDERLQEIKKSKIRSRLFYRI